MKLSLLKQTAISALMASSFISVSSPSLAQSVPILYESFVGDDDISQCNGAAYGTIFAPIGSWFA